MRKIHGNRLISTTSLSVLALICGYGQSTMFKLEADSALALFSHNANDFVVMGVATVEGDQTIDEQCYSDLLNQHY